MYKLETPESVAVTYPVAGIGSRLLATLIDTLVQLAVVAALAILMFIIIGVSGLNTSGAATYVALAIGILGATAVLLGYYIFFELIWNGQSPGKRAMRLRVIQISGYPVTPFAVLIRNVLRLVDFLPAYYGVGVITMIINKNSRRLGDLAAGTIVVKEGREGDLSALPSNYAAPSHTVVGATETTYAPQPAFAGAAVAPGAQSGTSPYVQSGTSPYAPAANAANTYGIDVSCLTREDEALMRDFLDRRHQLAYDRRNALAYQIAAIVYTHVGGQTPAFTAEGYLEYVVRMTSDERVIL